MKNKYMWGAFFGCIACFSGGLIQTLPGSAADNVTINNYTSITGALTGIGYDADGNMVISTVTTGAVNVPQVTQTADNPYRETGVYLAGEINKAADEKGAELIAEYGSLEGAWAAAPAAVAAWEMGTAIAEIFDNAYIPMEGGEAVFGNFGGSPVTMSFQSPVDNSIVFTYDNVVYNRFTVRWQPVDQMIANTMQCANMGTISTSGQLSGVLYMYQSSADYMIHTYTRDANGMQFWYGQYAGVAQVYHQFPQEITTELLNGSPYELYDTLRQYAVDLYPDADYLPIITPEPTLNPSPEMPAVNILPTVPAPEYSLELPSGMFSGMEFWFTATTQVLEKFQILGIVLALLIIGIVIYYIV